MRANQFSSNIRTPTSVLAEAQNNTQEASAENLGTDLIAQPYQLAEAGVRGVYVRGQEAAAGKDIVWLNKAGEHITLLNSIILPEQGVAFEPDTVRVLTPEQQQLHPSQLKDLLTTAEQKLQAALLEKKDELKVADRNWNVVNEKGKAALITLWRNHKNQTVAYIKLFPKKGPNPAVPLSWRNTEFERDTGYGEQSDQATRFRFNLKPLTVVGDAAPRTVDKLLATIEQRLQQQLHLEEDIIQQVNSLLHNIAAGHPEPTPGAAVNINAYMIDLGETAAPIALLTNHFVSGAYKAVETDLLQVYGKTWRDLKQIEFPVVGNEPLIDSYIRINKDTKLGISSKDKKGGAKASVTTVITTINKNPQQFSTLLSNRKYKQIYESLNLIKQQNAIVGPLMLAIKFKILNQAQVSEILRLIEHPLIGLDTEAPRLKKIGLLPYLSHKVYTPKDKEHKGYTLGYHFLAVFARLVSAELNKDSVVLTNFFKQVLEKSNMIQVKTSMKKSGTGAWFNDFHVIYPPQFEGKIVVDAGPNYFASMRPPGKLAFGFTK
jgi:hypothetical protein